MKALIGLTGKSGSGKSYAAALFQKWGAFVCDCDEIAHELLKNEEIKSKLIHAFGAEILQGGEIDRKALGQIVFSDSEELLKLNAIVHPAVIERVMSLCEASHCDICVMDGSELEASGADRLCNAIIVIECNEEIRLERIIKRDAISRESALLRMKAQKGYTKNAIRIQNNGPAKEFEAELYKIYTHICELNQCGSKNSCAEF